MKKSKRSTNFLRVVISVLTVFSLCSFFVVSADAGPEPHLKTPMFGVTRGQSVRASIVNTQTEGGVIAIIRYLAGDGSVLLESPEILLPLEQGGFVDLNGDTLPYLEQRYQLRVEVIVRDARQRNRKLQGNLVTVEVYENSTGKTSYVLQTWWALEG